MNPELIKILPVNDEGQPLMKVLAKPTSKEIRLAVIAENPLGVKDVTIITPDGMVDLKSGDTVTITNTDPLEFVVTKAKRATAGTKANTKTPNVHFTKQ